MTTARMTVGSLFGAVNSAATSVGSVFDTTNRAIGMANKFVTDMADKQDIRSIVDMHDFKEKLTEEKSMEETLRKKTISEFCKAEPENKEMFETAYNRISALLNPST